MKSSKKILSAIFAMALFAQVSAQEAVETVSISIPRSLLSLYETTLQGESPQDHECYVHAQDNIDLYPAHADALSQGHPKGTVTEGRFTSTKVYPGVNYHYWVYVPAQYDGSQDANFIVFQDGGFYLSDDGDVSVPTVLDNLIAKGDIPVTIALFVAPGDKGPGLPIYGGTDNRSVEYDSVDDRYASFLINELMPAAVGKYRLSQNPADCCIYGLSSSGVSALAVAWHRSNKFGGVISASGSFVNIRGGHVWPYAIRAHEKRPIKIYMTAGEKDLDIVFGHLLTANRAVAKALEYRDYDHIYVEHRSGHTGKVMRHLLPDALRWMWGGK